MTAGIFELGFELMDFLLERGALGLLLGSEEAVEGGFVFFVGVGGLVEDSYRVGAYVKIYCIRHLR